MLTTAAPLTHLAGHAAGLEAPPYTPGSSEPGSSALFVLVRRATLDKVLPELRPFGGKIIHTSLSTEQEARLRQALEDLRVSSGTDTVVT
jgi:Protein of unknown function (DUF1269)